MEAEASGRSPRKAPKLNLPLYEFPVPLKGGKEVEVVKVTGYEDTIAEGMFYMGNGIYPIFGFAGKVWGGKRGCEYGDVGLSEDATWTCACVFECGV
jgi:hypothetical protein